MDAIQLKKPDTIPILPQFSFFVARHAGMSIEEVINDPDKLFEAQWKTLIEFEPDMDINPFHLRLLAPILECLDYKQLSWAGHGLGKNKGYQFVEGEHMKGNEYDHFLLDPLDFMVRRFWPRVFGSLKGFEKLPPLHGLISYCMGIPTGFSAFSRSDVQQAMDTIKQASEHSLKVLAYSRKFTEHARQAGFPMQYGGFCQAPFDTLGDYFRGTRELMFDMFRRPEKVILACEKLLPIMLEMALNHTRSSGIPRVFIPIHKGIDEYMSEEQFKTFFWPTLRELLVGLIEQGRVPCLLWEGNCTSRLDIIKDIPAGKAIYAFESTDMKKAGQVLRKTVCIRGGVPAPLLAAGTPDEVRAYCRDLIQACGRGGGFIMDSSSGLDDAKYENIQAMFEITRELGAA